MRKNLVYCVFALLLPPFVHAGCQNDAKAEGAATSAFAGSNTEIVVPESLVKFSDQMNFKYLQVVERVKKGEQKAIKELLEYHGTTDDMDALNHAVVSLELIQFDNDMHYGVVIHALKPKLKALLIDRFTLAQGRTKNEALRKPMAEWAPNVWAALNNQPLPGACIIQPGEMPQKPGQGTTQMVGGENMRKPGAEAQDTETPQPSLSPRGTAPQPAMSRGGTEAQPAAKPGAVGSMTAPATAPVKGKQ